LSVEIVLFHSALGRRPAVFDFAQRLERGGHVVHVPDLYDGEVFDEGPDAAEKVQQLGFDEILKRGRRSVEHLSASLVYAGFSNGGACAELLAATRAGARGAVLIHAPLPIRPLGYNQWPATCPVQVHFAERDPLRQQAIIDGLSWRVRSAGASFEQFDYSGSGHLFTDAGRPGFDAAASTQLLTTVLGFLQRIKDAS
jgi:dienelactone hydrolase